MAGKVDKPASDLVSRLKSLETENTTLIMRLADSEEKSRRDQLTLKSAFENINRLKQKIYQLEIDRATLSGYLQCIRDKEPPMMVPKERSNTINVVSDVFYSGGSPNDKKWFEL